MTVNTKRQEFAPLREFFPLSGSKHKVTSIVPLSNKNSAEGYVFRA